MTQGHLHRMAAEVPESAQWPDGVDRPSPCGAMRAYEFTAANLAIGRSTATSRTIHECDGHDAADADRTQFNRNMTRQVPAARNLCPWHAGMAIWRNVDAAARQYRASMMRLGPHGRWRWAHDFRREGAPGHRRRNDYEDPGGTKTHRGTSV